MFFIIETLLLFIITIRFAGFLSIFLLITFFQQKRKQQTSNEEWESYFTKLGTNGFLWRLYVCFFAVLGAFAIIYTIYFWHQMWVYGITLMLAGAFHLYFKYRLNKKQIQERFLK